MSRTCLELDQENELMRRLRAKRGGIRAHQLHPDLARRAGSAGGRVTVERNPVMRTSEWGRMLVVAREHKKALARVHTEAIKTD